ncbi:hypothetical protein LCGC14_2911200 [marine sediment metagenome]|uniref:Uncharacterized protein n=1 Tax=marine sediment metagenome TaxID=412755 RepID=A0A0F8XRW7_9ZZZZ
MDKVQPVQCDICGGDATGGWQHTYCGRCATEICALEGRLNDLTDRCERKEEQLYDYQSKIRQSRAEATRSRADADRLQRKVVRLERQLGPFVAIVSLAREARDCGSPEARTLFVAAAVEGCANVSVGENTFIPVPEAEETPE